MRSSSSICNISLLTFSVISSLESQTAECRWIIHPHNPDLIVSVGPNAIRILDWNLAERQTYYFEHPGHQSRPLNTEDFTDRETVDRVLVFHDKNHILVQISLMKQNSKEKTFFYFDTSSWSTSTAAATQGTNRDTDSKVINPCLLPQNLSSQIALPLSFLSHNNLIFLSRTHSICSWRHPFRSGSSMSSPPPSSHTNYANTATSATILNTPPDHHFDTDTNDTAGDKAEPLFSLPGDWISRDCLALCSVWGVERSLLCPRNGEVAVVRCTALI